LLTKDYAGTCRVAPPRRVAAALEHDIDLAERDAVDLQRWPGVFRTDGCARFAWQCQWSPSCREPAEPASTGDAERGRVFCFMHMGEYLDRQRAAA
jgi:hypothetical protein